MATHPLVPEGYLPRIVDRQVEEYLRVFGALEIAGTKWCGKTWTALAHGSSVSYVDDDYELARADPRLVTLGDHPHVIDEWQLVPRIWDAVRREVDRSRSMRGGWILTGSSSPVRQGAQKSEAPKHSGAGRIGRIRMHPMTLAESGDSTSAVSLAGLFEGSFEPCAAPNDSLELVALACRGGWPEAIGMDTSAAQLLAREYLRLFYTESVPNAGKNGDLANRLVASVARTLGQAATYRTIKADLFGKDADGDLSDETLSSYLTLLKERYLIEEVPGWAPPARSRKRLAVKPKRYLADPSLAVAQLGMAVDSLLRDWQTFGLVFENLCMRDLLVYARALPGIGLEPVRYYRDDTGLEADAIIELADGRWAALEIKTSEDKVSEGIDSLKRLRKKLCEKSAARVREPEFMAVIVGIGTYAREVDDHLYVIPVRSLGA